jgi:excisionase family DNA binding protein
MNNKNETIEPEEKLLRKKEAASLLACSARTVDRLVSLGRLTRVKILGSVRFRLSQVRAIMEGGVS